MSTLISKEGISELDILNSPIRISKVDVSGDGQELIIALNTGFEIRTPLSLYPRLAHVAPDVIRDYRLVGKGMGVRWEQPDEDLSLKGFLQDAKIDFEKLRREAKGKVLDTSAAVQASSVLRVVNHKVRQEMIALIRDNAGITPTEIYLSLKLEQSVASRHLAQLRRAGIVTAKREGKNIRYYLNHARLEAVNQAMHLLAAA